ncbi:hypothetical protein B0H16DRAFT_375075 [Mycena metata]|uniref:F-box domain-containing protein n=1 Tax=Mycena metata TaxID=1033252 RepID=A0AAD7NLJ5_9AGAR|nr:hypothetical protein B0H16DRAFT_375075 [Mycena metata]
MSAHELQAHIDTISAEIEAQKEVLSHLERRRGAVQRQLNAIKDPVARLPLEISSEIFLQCLPSEFQVGETSSYVAPMLLLEVCNAWADIAISTPGLWAAFRIVRAYDAKRMGIWFRRARTCALTVFVRECIWCPDVALVLKEHSGQLKHLEIEEGDCELNHLVASGPFPSLETLKIVGLPHEYRGGPPERFSLLELLEILRLAPNLVECSFCATLIYCHSEITEILTLPALRSVKFTPGWLHHPDPHNAAYILRYLSLPNLHTMSLSSKDLSLGAFSLFLQRSAPPLQTLYLRGSSWDLSPQPNRPLELAQYLPSLIYLDLHDASANELNSALAELSPTLQTLKVHMTFVVEGFSFHTLRAALSSRPQLAHFKLLAPFGSQVLEDLEGFRRLEANGMEIYIGTVMNNLLKPSSTSLM